MKRIIPIIISLIAFCSCSESADDSSILQTSSVKSDESIISENSLTSDDTLISDNSSELDEIKEKIEKVHPAFSSFDQKYNYIKSHYPDKDVLIWIAEFIPQHEIEINDYLYNNGFDYVVCFKNITEFTDDDYYAELKDETDDNEDIDIISCFSVPFGKDCYSSMYYYLIEHGYLESLDKYLSDEKYAKYVELLPQKYWDSYRYDDHIYGIDNTYSSLYEDYGYNINKTVLDSCKLQRSDLEIVPSQMGKILSQINEETSTTANFNISFFTNDFIQANYICDSVAIINDKAQNVYESSNSLTYYKTIIDLKNNGLATIDSYVPGLTSIENIKKTAGYGTNATNNELGTLTVFYQQNNCIKNPTTAVGISKKSENKENAFDLLINLFLNKELNNIATYGNEGLYFHFDENNSIVMNQRVDYPETKYTPDVWYCNQYICYPCYDSIMPIYTNDIYDSYTNAEVLPGFGFYFDGSEYKDIYKKLAQIQYSFSANTDNIEEYLKNFLNELDNAGINTLINAINKELEKYNEKNN